MSAFDIKPEWLLYLQTVATEKSIRSAAEKLYLTEQALRYNLKALEDLLQTPLLLHSEQGLILSSQGQALVANGARFLRRLDQTRQRMQALSQTRPEFRLAVAYAYPCETLATILTEMYQRFPGLQLSVHLDSPREIEKQVFQGMFQTGLITWDPVHPRLTYVKGPVSPGIYVQRVSLPVEPFYLLPKVWRYSTHPPLVYPDEIAAYPVRYLGRIDMIQALCLLGAGIGFLPRAQVQPLLANGVLVETSGPLLDFSLHAHLLYRDYEQLSPPAQFFVERLQASWAEQGETQA